MSITNKAVDVFKRIDMRGGFINECWPWCGGHNGEGRPQFTLKGKKVVPYRLVYELVHGINLSESDIIKHKCGDKTCCNPRHLELGIH